MVLSDSQIGKYSKGLDNIHSAYTRAIDKGLNSPAAKAAEREHSQATSAHMSVLNAIDGKVRSGGAKQLQQAANERSSGAASAMQRRIDEAKRNKRH